MINNVTNKIRFSDFGVVALNRSRAKASRHLNNRNTTEVSKKPLEKK